MTRLYIYILTFSLLLAACSSEDTKSAADSGVAISFSTTMPSATTRAANAIDNKKNLKDAGGFGVFACYTGLHRYSDSNVHPDFMYNEHVTSTDDGSTWTYSPLKYWPNGEGETSSGSVTGENPHYVSFMAYAPYSDTHTGASGYCIPSFSLQGEIGNPWLTYRIHNDVSQQVDLLYAKHSNVHPILDLTKPTDPDSKVTFQFEHALACVGDRVTITCSDGMKKLIKEKVDTESSITEGLLTLKSVSVKYTLIERGRLIMWNGGEANWQSIASGNRMTTRTVTLTPSAPYELPYELYRYNGSVETYAPWQDANHGVFYIPLIPDNSSEIQTAEITVSYDLTYGATTQTLTGTSLIPIYAPGSSYAAAYESGKHLYLNVEIDNVTIYLTAAIAPWTDGGTTPINGVEVD